jgi:hypothetical protein
MPKHKEKQIKIGLMFMARILQRRVKRNMVAKFKLWKRGCNKKRLKLMRSLIVKMRVKSVKHYFRKWSFVPEV